MAAKATVIVSSSKLYLAGMVALMPALQTLITYATQQTAVPAMRALRLVEQLVDALPTPLRGPALDAASLATVLADVNGRGRETAEPTAESRFVDACLGIMAEIHRRSQALHLAA